MAGAPGIVLFVEGTLSPSPAFDPDSENDAISPPFSSPLALGVGRPISIELVLLAPLIPAPAANGGTNIGGMDDDCGGGGIVMDEAADPSLSCRLANEADTAGEGGTGVEGTDIDG